MSAWLVVALLVGCPAKRKPEAPEAPTADVDPTAARRTPVEGGRYWTEPGGLCLEVPQDWSGTAGPAPHLLSLRHPSGVALDLYAWPREQAPSDERAGWLLVFADDDCYRAVPILTPSGTATWRLDGEQGPTITAWRAELAGRWVSVEATFPFGEATAGLDVVEPLLKGLCTTFR